MTSLDAISKLSFRADPELVEGVVEESISTESLSRLSEIPPLTTFGRDDKLLDSRL